MIENLKDIIPYEIAVAISLLSPAIFYLYRSWLKSQYDKKLEKLKSELQKDNKKHEVRLANYRNYYQKVDEIQGTITEYSTLFAEEVAEISKKASTDIGVNEAMDYKLYIESYSKIIKQINDSMQELRNQTNEFRFYASDNLLKHIEVLDSKYEKYFSYSLEDNLKYLQASFDKAKNLDFVGILESMNSLSQKDDSAILQSEIIELHGQIKNIMRKELNLNE